MNFFIRILQNVMGDKRRRHASTEHDLVTGLIIAVGVITTFVRSSGDEEAQSIVTRSGIYLRKTLEDQIGYKKMNEIFTAAGLKPESHWALDRATAHLIEHDPSGPKITHRERLVDCAQRLDNVVKAVEAFGISECRENNEYVCLYLSNHCTALNGSEEHS